MEEYNLGIPPRTLARIAGVLYIINIILGAYEELGIRQRVLAGTAAATAANLHAMETLWRLGIASDLFLLATGIPLLMIIYLLLRPVNKPLAQLAFSFAMMGNAVQAASVAYLLQAVIPLGSEAYLKAFTSDQVAAMAAMAIKQHTYGFGVSLIFFACYQMTTGVLIFKSGYIPKFVGVLMVLGGAGYLVNNFALILYPPITSWLFPVSAVPALLGELSLALYLLIKGVNLERYQNCVIPRSV